jgi:hypothetical protein
VLFLEQVHKPLDDQGIWGQGERITVVHDDAMDVISLGLAGGGDLDGDGGGELVVGIFGQVQERFVSGVYLVSIGEEGAPSRVSLLIPVEEGGFAGPSVAVASQVQGDGMEGLLVGSWYGGQSWWLEAPLSSTSTLEEGLVLDSLEVFNLSEIVQVARVGDLDGDTLQGTVGMAFLWEGMALRFEDTSSVGLAVAGVGDLNGDGNAQLAIGFGESDGGRIGLTDGASTSLDWRWSSSESSYGKALAAAGDVNGDGRADVLVGCSAADRVDLFLGGEEGEVGPAAAVAQFHGGGVGRFLWAPGDLNSDGLDEVFLGAPERLEDGLVQGGVLLFAGPGL